MPSQPASGGQGLRPYDPEPAFGGRGSAEQYANNPVEANHGQLKRRLRPMRSLQTDQTVQNVIAGHAFLRNLRRER